ncbi:MAG TPA: 30S ribosomal protein S14 [Candidatus Nanoarchaeia archaeon]|nr:30S ribosomal protein S14 [Candidatus Nanoarchaeia archaeon]
MKNNAPKPRKHGRFTTKCRRCGRPGGHIGKYGLELCRTCFREVATSLGFKKYS